MIRSIHNQSVVLVLLVVTLLAIAVKPAAAQESAAPVERALFAQSAETPEATGDDTSDVRELPTSGHGHDTAASENFAINQMLTTILVLFAAALGGIAILWSYERR